MKFLFAQAAESKLYGVCKLANGWINIPNYRIRCTIFHLYQSTV